MKTLKPKEPTMLANIWLIGGNIWVALDIKGNYYSCTDGGTTCKKAVTKSEMSSLLAKVLSSQIDTLNTVQTQFNGFQKRSASRWNTTIILFAVCVGIWIISLILLLANN